jgi:tRNA pseudouridine38-40 synthase
MHRYALKFAYDGQTFDGYARQPEGRTVEEDIIKAMLQLGMIKDAQTNNFQSASRTDRGVSAAGNVISIDADFNRAGIIGALNSKLEDIMFYGIAKVDNNFNARYAEQRWYRYILKKDSAQNIKKLTAASKLFLGEHDFRHFSKKDSGEENTVLSLDSIELKTLDDIVAIDIRAQRFLWQMVRRVISAMLAVSDGTLEKTKVIEMLEGSALKLAGLKPVPAETLILMDVSYDFKFDLTAKPDNIFRNKAEASFLRSIAMGQLSDFISSS